MYYCTLVYYNNIHHKMNTKIANKYILHENIGSGCFGSIYSGVNYKTNVKVAIKMESIDSSIRILKHETSILKYLHEHGSRDIPTVYWFGVYNNNTCLVMPLYDCSLYDYIQTKPLSINKINTVMITLISIMKSIHNKLIIHRDIKPQNVMLKCGELFLIDFGFATFYVDESSNHIIDDGNRQNIVGTPKYVSFHVHCGSLPSRRDDLISLGYMYVYLASRKLPWDTLVASDEINSEYDETHILNYKNKQRAALKRLDSIRVACIEINTQIENFIKYCYYIQYDDLPNYDALVDIFSNVESPC